MENQPPKPPKYSELAKLTLFSCLGFKFAAHVGVLPIAYAVAALEDL